MDHKRFFLLAVLVLRTLLNRVVFLRDGLNVLVIFHTLRLEIARFGLQKLVIGYVVRGLGQLLRVGVKLLLLVLHELEVLEWQFLCWNFRLRHYLGLRLDVLFLWFSFLLD